MDEKEFVQLLRKAEWVPTSGNKGDEFKALIGPANFTNSNPDDVLAEASALFSKTFGRPAAAHIEGTEVAIYATGPGDIKALRKYGIDVTAKGLAAVMTQ